jgi:hypothetical protein
MNETHFDGQMKRKKVAEAINNLAAVICSIYEMELLLKWEPADLKTFRNILKENMAVNRIL